MPQTRRLPGGRGLWKGEDAYVGQNENFVTRASRIANQAGEALSSIPLNIAHTAVTISGASLFEILPIGRTTAETRPTDLYARITASSTGSVSNLICGIYVLEYRSSWRLIPASEVIFVQEAVGLLRKPIISECVVPPSTYWAIGWVKTSSWSGTATFAGQTIGATNIQQIWSRSGDQVLPPSIDLDDGTFSLGTTTSLIGLCYLPEQAADII